MKNLGEWRYIESAPIDGSTILLYNSKWWVVVCLGYWDSSCNDWRIVPGYGSPLDYPTHWAPIPKYPNT